MLASVRVVVITDRRLCADVPARLSAILARVPRGSVLVQVREKDLDGGPLLAFARPIVEVARGAGAPVFINDRVDVAVAVGANGVHLPERGLSVADARAVAPALLVGVSRHSIETAAVVDADLVQLGPIWSTPGKGEPLGPGALAVRSRGKLVAVGGIDSVARAREAFEAGADAVAMIRLAWSDEGVAAIAALAGH